MNIKEIDCSPPDEHEVIVKQLKVGKIIQFVTTHRLADGTLRTVEVHVSRITLQDQELSFSIVHDITERKKAEAQLKTMNEELEQRVEQRTRELQETQLQCLHAEKLSAIGKLSASIAHEFNNPLQGVITILKGLKRTAILEEEDKELLDLAIDENERMKKLIRSLQDFSQPSAGKRVMMDVHAAIDSLLLLNRSDFKQNGISTIRNYSERLPQIKAIPDQIKQVFLNLLNNAADACLPDGGMITIITRQEGQKIAVAIKDTGTGIAPEKLDLIFQPFYTTKSEVKGTGLGLSICHGIIQNHHGEILVESQEGQGSTFTVLLPVDGEN
jgi:signal transduction histidine kinase